MSKVASFISTKLVRNIVRSLYNETIYRTWTDRKKGAEHLRYVAFFIISRNKAHSLKKELEARLLELGFSNKVTVTESKRGDCYVRVSNCVIS